MRKTLKVVVDESAKQDAVALAARGVEVCRSRVADALLGKSAEHRAAVYVYIAALLIARNISTLTIMSDGQRCVFTVRQEGLDAFRFRTDDKGDGLYVMLSEQWFRALPSEAFSTSTHNLMSAAGRMAARMRVYRTLRKFSDALV